MQVLNREGLPQDYELVLLGDVHLGSMACSEKGFRAAVEYIGSAPNRFAILMGDEIEKSMSVDDPRFLSQGKFTASPIEQYKTFLKLVEPIRGHLITMLEGNHNLHIMEAGNFTQGLCKDLNIPYGTWSSKIFFCDVYGTQFGGYFTHGKKGARSTAFDPIRREANERLALKNTLKDKFGDCLIMAKGHIHKILIVEPTPTLFLVTNEEHQIRQKYTHSPAFHKSGYIHPDHRWYASTGSFLKTFVEGESTYSERAEYDPIEIGYVVVEVGDREIRKVRKVTV